MLGLLIKVWLGCSHFDWLFDNGITTGFPDGTLLPPAYVTRAQIAVFLQQLSGNGTTDPVVNADLPNSREWYDFDPAGLGYERISDSAAVGPGIPYTITLTCPAGKAILSGGGY